MALTTSPRRGVASPVPEGPLLPILTDERAERPVLGLWYPRQQGTIKAGDGRFYSPFVVGKAQICQNRDQLKVRFSIGMLRTHRTAHPHSLTLSAPSVDPHSLSSRS